MSTCAAGICSTSGSEDFLPPIPLLHPTPRRQLSAKYSSPPPPPPVLEWNSPSEKSAASPVLNSLSKSTGVPMVVIAGVVVGVAILLLILGVLLICCCCKKKKRKDQITPRDPTGKDGSNSGNMHHGKTSNPPSSENYRVSNNLPPPPGHAYRSSNPSSRGSSVPPDSNMSGNSGCPSYKGSDNSNISKGVGFSSSQSSFSYEELAMATNGFSKSNFLGQGGFGLVHKGTLRDGREVAIKSLKADSGQGEREFQSEIDVISRVHHKHLVSLVGYCITGTERMLVYEFVANNTLEFHLYGKGRPTMDWPTRLKIALGAAKGLAYLHEDCHPKIIHRDIKGANILLDFQFETKVADFGLAKITEDANTHVSTRVMGTFGYLAPEYASSGKLTEKSDVFSYGIMLLELITGRRPVDRTKSYMEDSSVWSRVRRR